MIEEFVRQNSRSLNFDYLSIGVFCFKTNDKRIYHFYKKKPLYNKKIFYDLASLTKPLTLSLTYSMMPEIFDNDLQALIEHRAGLKSWSLLSHSSWEQYVSGLPLDTKAKTLYSDLSAIRAMLVIKKKLGFKKWLSSLLENWDKDIIFWMDLEQKLKNIREKVVFPCTGFRNNKFICGKVNDHNAFNMKKFSTHAGLFSTMEGFIDTLFYWQKKFDLLPKMKEELVNFPNPDERPFIWGWDRISNTEDSFAGKGASVNTFGHLGFTGTSVWIDANRSLGQLIFTNATQNFSYDREQFKIFRKAIASKIWNEYDTSKLLGFI